MKNPYFNKISSISKQDMDTLALIALQKEDPKIQKILQDHMEQFNEIFLEKEENKVAFGEAA